MLSEKNGGSEDSAQNSKQWFVLIDDRYRGPYSETQIRSTIEQGGLAGANLIWKEGMVDWETLAKVAEFSLPDNGAPADEQLSNSALSFLDYMEPADEDFHVPPIPAAAPATAPQFELPPAPGLAFNTDFWLPSEERKKNPLWKHPAVTGAAVTCAAMLAIVSLWQLTRSGFPVLKDLPAREMQELRSVALDNYGGEAAAVAVAPGNLQAPRFYIAANVPDGSVIEVQLQGLRETMVDAFYYSSAASLKIKDHFAKSAPFVQANGKPLAVGEYTLTIFKNGAQLAQKSVFLGGVKDKDYAQRLAAYQNHLRVQGEGELSEIRQVTDLLEKQFGETNMRYKSGKGWERFHDQWMALQGQIEILFKEVNGETLNREFVHGLLYGMLNEATAEVSRLHAEQNNAQMLGSPDKQKIADLSRSAQSRLLTLRAKLLQSERQSGI